MASKVPKFGALEKEDSNLGHTGYFAVARSGNSGAPITNPNEPQMNREVGPSRQSKAPPKAKKGIELPKANEPLPRTQGVTFAGGEPSLNKDQGAPRRPQQRPPASRGPNPGRGGSVPVFGDWNNNPAQAGGYTVVFDKLHEDKKKGNIPSTDNPSTSNRNTPSRPIKPPKKGGCFPRLFR